MSIKVLIVDDSATARAVIRAALEKDPAINVVGAAQDAFVARDMIVKLRPDVICLDVEMPKMDGFHFAANVKEDDRFEKIPIVFNSSISDHFSELRGKEAGGEAYLTKFDASVFYKEISKVIKSHVVAE